MQALRGAPTPKHQLMRADRPPVPAQNLRPLTTLGSRRPYYLGRAAKYAGHWPASAALVAVAVVVVDDSEVEIATLGQPEGRKQRVVGIVVPVLRQRIVGILERPFEPGEDAVRDLDRVGEVGRHDDVLVVWRAVAEVMAEHRRRRHPLSGNQT